ncbi:LiaF domain-containing protein [Corynebacterium sp. NPDC060344]|uniref:LiaF domain-containing protein n=1 Tax=Corynebacterium sp. NPDC060344 TaxID=3347101 RepID=UPI00366720B9
MTRSAHDPGESPNSRRDRLQSRLEVAVGRGELSIGDYDDLCARVWDAGCDDESPELDAIAGRLERIEAARPSGAAPGPDPLGTAHSGNPYRQPDPYRPRGAHGGDIAHTGGPGGDVARRGSGSASGAGAGSTGAELVGNTPESERQDGRAALFSDRKMRGRWAPKATTTWWGVFGDVKLDLREADWPSDRIVLDFQSAMSETTIIVPPGTTIIDDTTVILGEVKIKASESAPANGLTVVIDGILLMSDLTIRDR